MESRLIFLTVIALSSGVHAWGQKDKVRLDQVKTLTLYHDKMTTGMRSSPVPQVQCVGGTAGCAAFKPQVVQCTNMGSDGFDVQWECKTDMDNAYRFGKIEVVCEGFDYADDPYVLKGSCGMEYTIDFTKEGLKQNQGHNYYGSGGSFFGSGFSYDAQSDRMPKGTKLGDLILLVIVALVLFGIYKTCLQRRQYSPTDDDPHGPNSRFGSGFGSASPPPPGFRTGYTPENNDGCSSSRPSSGTSGSNGFWTGAMTGGLLGYMFGNRNNGYGANYYAGPNVGRTWGGGGGFGGSGGSFSAGSTGTRTASGYGGSRRR